MKVVVSWAAKVPTGIDFCASAKSPDLLEPARIPANQFEKRKNNLYIQKL